MVLRLHLNHQRQHLLAAIAEERCKPEQSIVLVAGYSESAETAMAEFVVLGKPYKSNELRAAINRTIANFSKAAVTVLASEALPPSNAISAGFFEQGSVMQPQGKAANS